jgi:hypothetical protein
VLLNDLACLLVHEYHSEIIQHVDRHDRLVMWPTDGHHHVGLHDLLVCDDYLSIKKVLFFCYVTRCEALDQVVILIILTLHPLYIDWLISKQLLLYDSYVIYVRSRVLYIVHVLWAVERGTLT